MVGKRGRPRKYSLAMAKRVCDGLAAGAALVDVCHGAGMPSTETVRVWVRNDVDGFSAAYTRARETQADTLADEAIRLHQSDLDPKIMRVRLDAIRWFAGKVRPRKWGDMKAAEAAGNASGAAIANILGKLQDNSGGFAPTSKRKA